MNKFSFEKMLGCPTKKGAAPVQKRERGFDLATANRGFSRILKGEQPTVLNHSPMAWQVRAKGLG